ncbi:MAG: hypothetical protein NZ925_04695, partial [Sulfolobales archaeon]|nr:hypothetical protein [Sulfolobales archaeon]
MNYVATVAKQAEVDLLLLGGDVVISENFIKELSNIDILMVSGDEDDVHTIRLAKKYNVLLDGKVTEVGSVKIGGIGAISTSLNYSTIMSSSEKIDVLLTHYPPYGCLDRQPPLYVHSGLKSLRILLKTVRPHTIFVGHSSRPSAEYCEGALAVGTQNLLVLADSVKPGRIRFVPLGRI